MISSLMDPDYDEIVPRIQNILDSCSASERKMLITILRELAASGYSYTYEQVFLMDFKEVPVSIDRFISDPYYMGGVTRNGTGVYPYWRDMMHTVFSAGNRYTEIVLTGATRVGKTSTSVTVAAYMLYRLMLYRNPHEYFKKKEVSRFTIGFANLTKELAMSVAYREYNDTLKDCPWFMEHGSVSKSDRNFYYIPEGDKIEIIPASDSAMLLGKQLWCCIMDEINFAKAGVKDINIAKRHMKNLYDTANARISGTFRIGGEVYGKMITASSKNTDSDFLSDHIETQLRANNEHIYIVDEPQWNILPESMFSKEVFHFTVGDRYKKGFVIPEENDDDEHIREYESQGYKVIEAPAEFRTNFIADYDISLRDIAGISVTGAMGFITQESITPCVSQDRQNPFFEDILVMGSHDDNQIADFFHEEVVPAELKNQQMNIHIDFGETKNRTGIVGSCVSGNKIIENAEGKKVAMPFIKEVFAVGIEAPRGDRQSFQKLINFIVYLRSHHFNVGTISTDSFQSDYVRETLEQQGFTTSKISVVKSMEPFIGIKNLLIDQRIELVRNQKQEDELVGLQRINNKIESPVAPDGGHGDIAEALTGSCWTLVTEQITARPPARSVMSIASAVNRGSSTSNNPMSSANTINTGSYNPLGSFIRNTSGPRRY